MIDLKKICAMITMLMVKLDKFMLCTYSQYIFIRKKENTTFRKKLRNYVKCTVYTLIWKR